MGLPRSNVVLSPPQYSFVDWISRHEELFLKKNNPNDKICHLTIMSAEATTTATAASPTEVKPTITTGSPVAAAASSAPASPGGDMIHPQKIGGELDADPKKKWGKFTNANATTDSEMERERER